MASPHDGHYDSDFIHEISDSVEALTNLIYLIQADSHNATKVRSYAENAEKLLKRLREIIEESRKGNGSF